MRKTYTYGSWGNDERTVTTGLVSSVTEEIRNQAEAVTWSYSYDTAGNLSEIDRRGKTYVRYEYDSLNRLIREENYAYDKGFFWVYDKGGNIVERREYDLEHDEDFALNHRESYSYPSSGWRDQINAPFLSNADCEYDAMGNPTTYFGSTLEWSHVRRMTRFDGNTFAYDGAGKRIRKNNTTYLLDEGRIMKEIRAEASGTVTLTYMYGVDGVIGFLYNGAEYYYNKNLQGDVLEIYALDGTQMASYLYDAWGRVLQVNEYSSLTLGALNPYRYRGYYYDTETGLYYLETRYYDPARGRFLNPDSIEYLEPDTIGGLNLYAYCNNNPVMYSDPGGHSILAAVVIGFVVGAAVGGTIGGTIAYRSGKTSGLEDEDLFWATMKGIGKGAMIGGALGGLAGATGGVSLLPGSGLLTPAVVSGGVAVSSGAVAVATGLGILGSSLLLYEGKKVAPRIHSNSRKQAYQKAFYKGGKKIPKYHSNGKFGPHYHPANPKYKHWHYYFTVFFGVLNSIDD